MHSSKVIPLLMSSIHSALPSGVSLTHCGQSFVALAVAVRLRGLTWSLRGFMSSYLVSALSLSLAVLTYLLVVVFLSRRYLLSFVLKRPAYALLGYLWFHQCWPPELLCHLLASPLHHSCLLLQGGGSSFLC